MGIADRAALIPYRVRGHAAQSSAPRLSPRSSNPAIRWPGSANTCAVSAGSFQNRYGAARSCGTPRPCIPPICARAILAGVSAPFLSRRHSWEDDAGAPFAFRFLDFWHADREKSKNAGKNRGIDPTRYTDEDLEFMETIYEAEETRGQLPGLLPTFPSGTSWVQSPKARSASPT